MSFECQLAKVKQIPIIRSCVVFGYVRNMELEFDNDSAYYNIPDLVTLCILCYYYQFAYFMKYGPLIAISNGNDEENNVATMTKYQCDANSAYYGDWIQSMDDKVIKCKLQVNVTEADDHYHSMIMFLLGITSNDESVDEGFLYDEIPTVTYLSKNVA